MQPYDAEFYAIQREGARRSARHIVPLVLELSHPRSVVDVGCGVGTWLTVFQECGIDDFRGIDGEYVTELLEIPHERFLARDLRRQFRIDRQFDLVVSLEVAEHLPSECAKCFVDSLAALGSVVLFSAAIPFQGGTGHLNEQWPDYWASLFARKGYMVIDAIRPKIWEQPEVEWWYAQNALMFARRDRLDDYPLLAREAGRTCNARLSMVHPRKYLQGAEWMSRVELTRQDLAAVVPSRALFIFVDQQQLGAAVPPDRVAVPFLEKDGQYWGPPADDGTALRELERLRRAGASFVAFAWPAFWWLDHYPGLGAHLRADFNCVLRTDRVVVFDLGTREPA